GGETAITPMINWVVFVRDALFPNETSRKEHSLVHVTMKNMATAHLYPVEPPLPPPVAIPPRRHRSGDSGDDSEEIFTDSESGAEEDEEKEPFDPRSDYLKALRGTLTSSQRSGRVVSRVRALDATEAERIEDRLGGFIKYGEPGDLELMDQLFRLGCLFRSASSRGMDWKEAGEIKIDESIVLKTISDSSIGRLGECRLLFDCIYGKREAARDADADADTLLAHQPTPRIGCVQLNAAQTRAIRLYADPLGPRVFCILSPPGSGKTTVAAAMAAEVGR
ncbi:hypothetical protein PMAYCL1PPCAC_19585, partial [Pristionchus mayeri]